MQVKLFLQIVGGVTCSLATILLLLWLLIRRAMRGRARREDAFAPLMRLLYHPAEIRLVRQASLAWEDESAVAALAQPLRDLGFREAGLYEAAALGGLRLRALANPEAGTYGLIYERPASEPWLDVVILYRD